MEEYFAANRAGWDERVGIHLRDDGRIYGLDAIRRGESVLGPIEAAEIGDISGMKVAHLQCHFGLDTISLSRLGATVTGLDFSPVAIATARQMAAEMGDAVTFVESNVYDAPAAIGTDFDMVFTGWGAIGWLPDLDRWARAVAGCLRPGGKLYLIEGHPMLGILDEREGRIEPAFDWRTPADQPLVFDMPDTYAGDGSRLKNARVYEWNHPMSRIVTSLLDAGLVIVFVHEHEMLPWRAFPSMVPAGTRMFRLPDGAVKFPLAYSIRAKRTKR
ncbi:MAG: class I SAM-dependent methyltransferase [Bauldia sp.]